DAGRVQGFATGESWALGEIPWRHRLRMAIAANPLILAGVAILCALLLGLGVFLLMRTRIGKRA
ncbi:MAG: hypothetical protein HUK26_09300, partial [Duodenibacillus sp.]|nr:hypothetical protein [Duodenibacillus sp.]